KRFGAVGIAVEQMDLARAQHFQRQDSAARRAARAQQHHAFSVQGADGLTQAFCQPQRIGVAAFNPVSRKTSRLAAPAACAGVSTRCAMAKADSLCGTGTLTPLKPARRTPSITAVKSSTRAARGPNA